MATITAKDVMALRKASGLGMMEAKKALTETNGDMEAAKELLRKKGLAKMDGRTDRESAEGKIAIAVEGSKGAIVLVNTETDFTANNDMFIEKVQIIANEALKNDAGEVVVNDSMQTLIDDIRVTTKENAQFGKGKVLGGGNATIGSYLHFTGKIGVLVELEGEASDDLLKDLCMHISAISPAPLGVNEDEIPADIIEKEREIAKAQAIESGKPEAIAEKMVEGKIRKYLDEVTLTRQKFVKDDKKQIKDILPAGVSIKQFVRYQIGG
ncbi:Elongation factor Ts [Poriferisphaera corsica]|uniref:Elongation factor Ts n=1 Tax=Poriferisphaera corsica TaxID=2528020 RepID=A0A517YXL0_9BACT|nr:translation elongation factor Ts [Poriferisphaera corsica]QDU34962.1 Elongation factor Ts [Poriferisphaera corsica]